MNRAERTGRGGAKRVLWVEQFWKQKLDREIFADCPSTKIGSLENFQLYGSLVSPVSDMRTGQTLFKLTTFNSPQGTG